VQERVHHPLRVAEQREQHVHGLDLLVVACDGLLVGTLEGRAAPDGQPVEVHVPIMRYLA
jgi:hypothetical protein